MNVYLVREYWGGYADYGERLTGAFASREQAESFIQNQTTRVYMDKNGNAHTWKEDGGSPWPQWINPQRRAGGDSWYYPQLDEWDASHFEVIEMEVQE